MASTTEKNDRHQIERLDTLIREVERFADPAAQAHAREMVQTLMDLHGTGLARIVKHLEEAGEPGQSIIAGLARDKLVGSLLLLYGLHPLDLETRVRLALDGVRPALQLHGGSVELRGITGDTVRLRLQGSCKGCPSSAMTLKLTIEEAVYEAAPEVAAIEVEDEVEYPTSPPSTRVSLPLVLH